MKKTLLFFLLMITFGACTHKKPKDLLSQAEMTDLLYELILIGAIESSSYRQDTVYITQMPNEIIQKYNLDSVRFVEQHRYYLQHEPQIYVEMFDSIQLRFQKKAEEFNAPTTIKPSNRRLTPIKKMDSIVSQLTE